MALVDYASSHEYALGTLNFVQLYGPKDGKEVEAILGDEFEQPYINDTGSLMYLDTFWIMFKDKTFQQYAIMDDQIVPSGSGTYEFDAAGDFAVLPDEEDSGKLTMNFVTNLYGNESAQYTFDMKTLGMDFFYIIKPDNLPDPPVQ